MLRFTIHLLVRAFSGERAFLYRHFQRMDTCQRFWYYSWMLNRCMFKKCYIIRKVIFNVLYRASVPFRYSWCCQCLRSYYLRHIRIHPGWICRFNYRQRYDILNERLLDLSNFHRFRTEFEVCFSL